LELPMRVIETALPEVRVLEPTVHRDDRGFFLESFRADRLEAVGISETFVQDNHSRSIARTLRGLHWQWRRPQAKLIRVVAGAIFDVVVDIRRRSPGFGRWVGVNLSSDDFRQLYVPIGFAHGFCVLTETADIEYKCSDYYDPAGEAGLRWDDPAVGINWPVNEPILSSRDARHPPFGPDRADLL
jgi:dTDP-4-dehydrorhamnose 3,5-epimerase